MLGLRGLGRANFMPEKVLLVLGGVEDGETEKISLYEIIDHWPLPKKLASKMLLGQQPQRANVLWNTEMNFYMSVYPSECLYIHLFIHPPRPEAPIQPIKTIYLPNGA